MAVALHWFRKGLRLHDNPALLEACKGAERLYPVFIIDPWFANPERVGVNRYRFLLESLRDLDAGLRRLNSRLFVVRGKPLEVLPQLITEWGVSTITFEADTEPYARVRDAAVNELAAARGVAVVSAPSHTLYDPERLLAANQGQCPASYTTLTRLVERVGPPARPLNAPSALPPFREGAFRDDAHSVPTLEDMGYSTPEAPSLYPGGETEALRRMEYHLSRQSWVAVFSKPDTPPNSLEPSTTVLSPYLKFGCLSPRSFFWGLLAVTSKIRPHTQPPESLTGQLLWREYFYLNGYTVPNFDRMAGNPICRQIPWRSEDDAETQRLLSAWEEGRTGYPFIDAIMNQLRSEGWIHHLARHAVACFLTRGHLWVSWELGARVFERYLLDADWSLNTGNWLWLSASAFFYQYFRVYSPIAFGKNTDKSGGYIRKYVPQLAKFPDKYIYEPWKAPMTLQHAAGCIVGRDYPRPIVEHDVVSKANMERMKRAYDEHNQKLKPQQSRPGRPPVVAGKQRGKQADAASVSVTPAPPSAGEAAVEAKPTVADVAPGADRPTRKRARGDAAMAPAGAKQARSVA